MCCMKGYNSNFLIMRRYLFCITTLVLFAKISYLFIISLHLFLVGTGVPAFMSTSNARILSSSGDHDDLCSGGTTSPLFLWNWLRWFQSCFTLLLQPGTVQVWYWYFAGGGRDGGGINVDGGGGVATCWCRGRGVRGWGVI